LRATHAAQQFLVFDQREAHLLGDFAFDRRTAQLLLQLVHCGLDGALLLARAARQVVGAAQLVEHGAADALGGEGLELHALRGVEAAQRVGQADHADLDQIVELHVGRQLGDHLVGQATHQRAVLLELGIGVELAFGGVHWFSLR
jgi:hypothetical protein